MTGKTRESSQEDTTEPGQQPLNYPGSQRELDAGAIALGQRCLALSLVRLSFFAITSASSMLEAPQAVGLTFMSCFLYLFFRMFVILFVHLVACIWLLYVFLQLFLLPSSFPYVLMFKFPSLSHSSLSISCAWFFRVCLSFPCLLSLFVSFFLSSASAPEMGLLDRSEMQAPQQPQV